jgi:phenylacetate-coenzyme A ligase PaaK-like adenylate-forming protein
VVNTYIAMAAVPSSLFDLPLSAAYDSARWSKAALDVWTGSLASSAAIATQREQRLVALVAHAFEFSPYYSRLYRKLPVSSSSRLRLSDLPPVTKRSLMAEFDDVITEPTVTRRAVDEFVAQPDCCGGALLGRYSVWTSSGTTGEPGYFVHDPDAIAVYDALEWQRFRGVRSASDLARQLIAGDRYAMVAATGGHFAGISTVERMRRSMPWLTASLKGFSLLQPLERLVAELNEFRPTLLASYPTAAQMLADEQHAGRLNLRLREVWTGGETLPNPARAQVQRAFGCPVRNSYGASEFLPIAWECPYRRLHLNSDWVILEPIDHHGRPVAAGTRSHSVLLTNLANRIQPLIRYDLGDAVTIVDTPCGCGSRFPVMSVEGRTDEALVFPLTGGGTATVVPLALTTVMEDDACVHDFQVTQTAPRKLQVRLGGDEHGSAAEVRRALSSYFDTLGIGAVSIDIARRPPARDQVSGKLRRVICQLHHH